MYGYSMRSTSENWDLSTTTFYQNFHQYLRTPLCLKELCLDEQLNKYDCRTKLSDLNDDCLLAILTKLSFKEKVGLIRVSKRWKRVLKKVIDNDDSRLQISGKTTYPARLEISLNELLTRNSQFIEKFGSGIKEVWIYSSSGQDVLEPTHLDWLFRQLIQLQKLEISSFGFESRDKKDGDFIPGLEMLESLKVTMAKGQWKKFVKQVMKLGNLKKFVCDYNKWFEEPRSFLHSLESLQVDFVKSLDISNLLALENLKKLKSRLYHTNEFTISSILPLNFSIRSFEIGEYVHISHKQLQCFLDAMLELKYLKFTRFIIECCCQDNEENCGECSKKFVEVLAIQPNLQFLILEKCPECPDISACVLKFIENGKFQDLKVLELDRGSKDVNDRDGLSKFKSEFKLGSRLEKDAFWQLAQQRPKELMVESTATFSISYGSAYHKDKIKVIFLRNLKGENKTGYQFWPREKVEFNP